MHWAQPYNVNMALPIFSRCRLLLLPTPTFLIITVGLFFFLILHLFERERIWNRPRWVQSPTRGSIPGDNDLGWNRESDCATQVPLQLDFLRWYVWWAAECPYGSLWHWVPKDWPISDGNNHLHRPAPTSPTPPSPSLRSRLWQMGRHFHFSSPSLFSPEISSLRRPYHSVRVRTTWDFQVKNIDSWSQAWKYLVHRAFHPCSRR